jgi:hypothetical protein
MTFLAANSHSRNLSIGLKNAGEIIPSIIDSMQWSVNEQCVQYSECDTFRPFIDAGMPVFHIEYPNSAPSVSVSQKDSICNNQDANGFSSVLKQMSLSDWVDEC